MDKTRKKLDDLTVRTMTTIHRREGFPGQHHVVLPPSVIRRAMQNPLLRGLMPTDAGFYPHADGHFVDRDGGAAGAVLLVCTAGSGFVRWKGRQQEVTAGGVVLLPPSEAHVYGADDSDPWTLEWAHFTGGEVALWREAILGERPDSACLDLPPRMSATLGVARVHERLEVGYDEPQLLAASAALRWSLAELSRLRHLPGNPPTLIEAIESTAAWMREHLDQRFTLPDLAARARLSPSHFSVVFRRRFGYAPVDWLIRQRIQRACHHLDATDDKVEVVGRSVGFQDPYYFSRAFRRVMGVSPRRYRATIKG